MAEQIKDSLLKDGRVKRGFLGIRMQGLENSMLKHFGVPPGTQGVLVADVLPDTPAARAGLAVGDVLLSVMGNQQNQFLRFVRCPPRGRCARRAARLRSVNGIWSLFGRIT